MINVNDFLCASDSETFEKALQNRPSDGLILIPPRVSQIEPERDYWLIDRAILLPENTTIVMRNSTIKLSDRCRDNFFRTANCGMGIPFPDKISNIHIRGEGTCVLMGADHPRAVGDSSKLLKNPCPHLVEDVCAMADYIPAERRTPEALDFDDIHYYSYGTDAGKEGESQYGDWRGIGILFANTEHFSIENIQIIDSHGWGISLEACSFGKVRGIHFDAHMCKMIDGICCNMENQDGIDVRNGCHDILISDITGVTGDDVVALTAIASATSPGGSTNSTHVMPDDWTIRDKNIYNITIKNVVASSTLCLIVRVYPINASIRNVVIDGIQDTTPPESSHWATICLGGDGYGGLSGEMSGIIISNVICNAGEGISVDGYLRDSVISNVVNMRKDTPLLKVNKPDGMVNVQTANLVQL